MLEWAAKKQPPRTTPWLLTSGSMVANSLSHCLVMCVDTGGAQRVIPKGPLMPTEFCNDYLSLYLDLDLYLYLHLQPVWGAARVLGACAWSMGAPGAPHCLSTVATCRLQLIAVQPHAPATCHLHTRPAQPCKC
jgi:hypothetical protein